MQLHFRRYIAIACLFSCSANHHSSSKEALLPTITDTTSESALICYDYLVELIRSSNFPFRGIHKTKVNMIVDTDETDYIKGKLLFDTEGTGTLGWVIYYPKERKLMNISADLDRPVKLEFDTSLAKRFEKCRGMEVIETDSLYNKLSKINGIFSLPITGFNNASEQNVDEELSVLYWDHWKAKPALPHTTSFGKLPFKNEFISGITFCVFEDGSPEEYLVTVSRPANIVSSLRLYFNSAPDGNVDEYEYSTYEIFSQDSIIVTTAKDSLGTRITIKVVSYFIDDAGKIIGR